MSAILYVMRKGLKNSLLELLHHPLKLILYAVVAGLILFSGIVNMVSGAHDAGGEAAAFADIRLLEGIYFGLLLLVTIPTLLMGMRSGANLFSMADVNFFFVSPLPPKTILLYGLLKQMGSTLFVCFFLLAYGGMAVENFGISIGMALALLVGWAVAIFLAQVLTMLTYSFVNGNPARIRGVKAALVALLLVLVAYLGGRFYLGGFSMESAYAAIASPVLEYVPFVGWLKGLLFALYEGRMTTALVCGGLLAAGTAGALLLFIRSRPDYYEDVLQSAESTYAIKAAAKEGRTMEKPGAFGKKLRVGATGLGHGWGASAFFFRHLREIRRRSRFVFIGTSTVSLVLASLFMGFIMTHSGDGDPLSPNLTMMVATIMGIYLLFFLNAAGEWSREFTRPYLVLVPESPLKKLLWASLTSLLRPAIDGAIAVIATALLVGAPPLTALMCFLLYAAFGALFTASNILSERLLGQMANKGLIMVLYMFMLLLLTAPGLVAGILIAVLADGVPKSLAALPVVGWNLLAALGIYALCRTTLHDMEAR